MIRTDNYIIPKKRVLYVLTGEKDQVFLNDNTFISDGKVKGYSPDYKLKTTLGDLKFKKDSILIIKRNEIVMADNRSYESTVEDLNELFFPIKKVSDEFKYDMKLSKKGNISRASELAKWWLNVISYDLEEKDCYTEEEHKIAGFLDNLIEKYGLSSPGNLALEMVRWVYNATTTRSKSVFVIPRTALTFANMDKSGAYKTESGWIVYKDGKQFHTKTALKTYIKED